MGLASRSEGAHGSVFGNQHTWLLTQGCNSVVRPVPVSVRAVGVCGTSDCPCVFAVLWGPELGSEPSWFSKKKETCEALEVHEGMLDPGLVRWLR